MNMKEFKCPKCQSNMIEGSLLTGKVGLIPIWIPGKPEKSFWTWHGLKWNKEQQHSVGAFRCESCGYLELYAPHETDL